MPTPPPQEPIPAGSRVMSSLRVAAKPGDEADVGVEEEKPEGGMSIRRPVAEAAGGSRETIAESHAMHGLR